MQLSVRSQDAATDLAVSPIFALAKGCLNRVGESRMQSHRSAEHEERAAEDERDVIESVGKEPRGPLQNREGRWITVLLHRMVEDLSGRQLFGQASPFRVPCALPLSPDTLTACHAFECAGFSGSGWFLRCSGNKHVANLTCRPISAAKRSAIQENAGADAGTDCQKHEILCCLCNAGGKFAQRGEIYIVIDRCGNVENALKHRLEWNVAPSVEIGSGQDDAGVYVSDAGSTGCDRAQSI